MTEPNLRFSNAWVERRLGGLKDHTDDVASDQKFVDRVMGAVLRSDRDLGFLMIRAARRSAAVCGALVLVAVWWAIQSQGVAASAYIATGSPLEAAW